MKPNIQNLFINLEQRRYVMARWFEGAKVLQKKKNSRGVIFMKWNTAVNIRHCWVLSISYEDTICQLAEPEYFSQFTDEGAVGMAEESCFESRQG
jgi:hypothetical protein